MALLKQSAVYVRSFKMIDSADHFSKKTGLTCTVNISKAGAAFGAAAGAVTEIGNGWYKISLTTADTNTLGDLAFYITAAGADDTDFVDQVSVSVLGDTLSVNVTTWNGTAVATPATAGIPDVNAKNINNVSTSSVTTINANQGTTQPVTFTGTGASALVKGDTVDWAGTSVSTPTVAGVPNVNAKTWNDLATVALPLVPTVAGRALDVSAGGEAGLDWANVGSPTTTLDLSGTTIKTTQKVDVDTIKTNPVVNGGTVTFPTNATLASTTNITAGTVTTAINVTTVNGLAAGVITAASIASDAITAAKVADGTIDAATFAAGAINASAIATDAITAAKIAADAIGASELAADAVAEIQSGLATPTNITAGTITNVTNVTNRVTANVDQIAGDGTAPGNLANTFNGTGYTAATGPATQSQVSGINAKTANLPATPAATGDAMTLTSGERNAVADAYLDRADAVEVGLTPRGTQRLLAAAEAGRVSGATGGATTIVIKNAVANTKTRITATVDANGNRTAVTADTT